jgi:diguanylate cyclase (GGDEF)-like protein/PAS domain S-box-containing protein
MPKYWRYMTRTGGAVLLACIALLAVVWIVTLERISYEREEAIQDAIRHNSNLAVAFEEHTIRTLRGLDRVVRFIKREAELKGRSLDTEYLIQEGSVDLSVITTAAAVDEHGEVILSMTRSEGVNVADRDYFQYHANNPDSSLRIGTPQTGRVTGRSSIHLTRRIEHSDGSFAGVALVAVDPNYFVNFYNVIDLGKDGLVLLVGLDGTERARATGKMQAAGQDMRSSTLFRHLAVAPVGKLETIGRTDGVRRYMSYRTVKDFPLVVAVAMSQDEVLEDFHRRHYSYLLGASLASVLALIFSGALVGALHRQKLAMENAMRGETALKESEYRLDLALEASGFAVWSYDFVTGDVTFSRHWWGILGYSPNDVPPRIKAWEERTHPADLPRVKTALGAHLKGTAPTLDVEYRMQAKNGEWRWIRTVGRVVERDANGRALRGTGTHGDVTARKEQEWRVERLTRIHQVLSGINSAIVRIRDRHELFDEACRIAVEYGGFGIACIGKWDPISQDVVPIAVAGTVVDRAALKTTARDDTPLGQGVVGRAIRQGSPVFCNNLAAEPDVGSEQRREALRLGYRSDIALPLFEAGALTGTLTLYAKEPDYFTEDEVKLLVELAGDVSFALDTISKEEKLNYLAYYDPITGAANRNLLNDRLKQAVVQARRYGYPVAVAVINLDHFKLINDSLGHTVGDELLQKCFSRIHSCVRETDTLARFAGDEFILVLPAQSDTLAASRVIGRTSEAVSSTPPVVETLQRVLDCMSAPVTLSERELSVTCSIGVSLYPQDGEDPEILLRNAAAALSRAKELGRKNFQFYTPALNAQIAERLSLHSALRHALERDEFTLHYQPKISLATGTLSGCEALLRWDRPGTGLISPGAFIPVLEETGLIIEVGRRATEKAAATWRKWKGQHGTELRIAVNVSQLQLAQKDFADVVGQIVCGDGSATAGVDLEITESLIMQDIESNIAKLQKIRDFGSLIAIDDFGTGHSSLSYLARLPVDILKIDRAFVADVDTSADSVTLVTSMISLAHSLGLKVVAEGVETEKQLKVLQLLKCDEIQGYVVSRPLPEDQFEAWCKNHRANGVLSAKASSQPKDLLGL